MVETCPVSIIRKCRGDRARNHLIAQLVFVLLFNLAVTYGALIRSMATYPFIVPSDCCLTNSPSNSALPSFVSLLLWAYSGALEYAGA